jgi:hypothetical protein
MNNSEESIFNMIENAKALVLMGNRTKKIPKLITKIYRQMDDSDRFCEFFETLFSLNPVFFNDQIINNYYNIFEKRIKWEDLMDLHIYMIRKHMLYPGEYIKRGFPGKVDYYRGKIYGDFFITNYRIILVGKAKMKMGRYAYMFLFGIIPGIVGFLTMYLMKGWKKNQAEYILNQMDSQIFNTFHRFRPNYGYHIPLFGVFQKKRRSTTVT